MRVSQKLTLTLTNINKTFLFANRNPNIIVPNTGLIFVYWPDFKRTFINRRVGRLNRRFRNRYSQLDRARDYFSRSKRICGVKAKIFVAAVLLLLLLIILTAAIVMIAVAAADKDEKKPSPVTDSTEV